MPPRAYHERRITECGAVLDRIARREGLVANARLLVFLAAVAIAVTAWRGALAAAWVWLPLAAFVLLVAYSRRLSAAGSRSRRLILFHQRGIARLDLDWDGLGDGGERFLPDDHPYARDLDLFGKRSLFQLLSIATTRMGEAALARSLLDLPPLPETLARQEAVRELRDRRELREDLAALKEDLAAGVDPERLAAWADGPAIPRLGLLRAAGIALAVLATGAFAAWRVGGWLPAFPFAAAAAIGVAFALRMRPRVREIERASAAALADLELLSRVLGRIERESFRSPLLAGLRADLAADGVPASRQVARLARRVSFFESRRNPALGLLWLFLLAWTGVALFPFWGTSGALAIEAWRTRSGRRVGRWLAAAGSFEELLSLANHADEHPEDPFPECREGRAFLEAEGMGHPLISGDRLVRNDLRLDAERALLVVSGSNMSGKSTYLRTAGVNVVLARIGVPVRARRMSLAPLSLGCSIRIEDSLQDGRSHFYAEIRRLKLLTEIAGSRPPHLFLLDEILHGTNSHDRLMGAEAAVKALLDAGAVGLVTTHDLAITRMAERFAPRAGNIHFQDAFRDGALVFDYAVRPGVVARSNALDLMRSIGLPV